MLAAEISGYAGKNRLTTLSNGLVSYLWSKLKKNSTVCIWAVQLATRPNLADGRQLPGVQLTQPTAEQRTFADVGELEPPRIGVAVTSLV
jgi:hypothetical protein